MTSLFTALLLLFWLRLVPVPREEAVENPLVSVPLNQADRLADLIRPAFGRRATRPFAAFLLLALLLVLRGALASAVNSHWTFSVGPAVFQPAAGSPRECILFSFLLFAWTIERLWLLLLVVGWIRRRRQPSLEDGLARSLGMPVSAAPRWFQLILVALLTIVVSHATIVSGMSISPDTMAALARDHGAGSMATILQLSAKVIPDFATPTPKALALLVAGAFADVFSVAADATIAFVFACIIGLIFRLPYWIALGNAGLSYLVGSVFRSTMSWGGMSFAPLLFLMICGILYLAASNAGMFLVLTASGSFSPEVIDDFRRILEGLRP